MIYALLIMNILLIQNNNFTREADIAISDRKNIRPLQIFPPDFSNIIN